MSLHDSGDALTHRIATLTRVQRAALAERLRLRRAAERSAPSADTARLTAHLVLRAGAAPPQAEELRRFLAEQLPPFMIPASFITTERLPLLPNGKVDRQALAASASPVLVRSPGAPAANPVEAQLMRIWDDLIDFAEIGRDDNFFELGGHSLLVPRLIDRIRRDFGVTLPLGSIFAAPTVRALAELITSRKPAPAWRCLVGIRERGSRPPFYLVHGLGGEIGYFYNLAEHLNPDQPIYGLQAPVEPFDDLEKMAAQYLSEIRRHQPRGPYLLGGYCVGGCVAYEMARRLVASGESVQLLALVDAVMPGPRSLRSRLQRLTAREPRDLVATIGAHARRLRARLSTSTSNGLPDLSFYGVPQAFQAVAGRHYRAQLHYAPGPYPGDMWLFRSHDGDFEPDLGWRPLVGGRLEIRHVGGRHADVLKPPHLAHTARHIATALEDALATHR